MHIVSNDKSLTLKDFLVSASTALGITFSLGLSIFADLNSILPDGVTLKPPYDVRIDVKYYLLILLLLASNATVILFLLKRNSYFKNNQDRQRIRVLCGKDLLLDHLYAKKGSVVKTAKTDLVITGSRSRDEGYLRAIENAVRSRKKLIYMRVLFEPIRKQEMVDHIKRLIELRRDTALKDGTNRIQISCVKNTQDFPERFICASESKAVIILPSINEVGGYDTFLIVNDKQLAQQFVNHVKGLYRIAFNRDINKISDVEAIKFESATE